MYGSTAARIVSKILNRWIVCLQNHPTDNWCGVPDFHFQSADGSEVILVGEGQVRAVDFHVHISLTRLMIHMDPH